MTDELTKTFFDTFGIEPRGKKCTCAVRDFAKCTTYYCTSCAKALEKEYPQITDRILLELICICSQYGFCPTARNIKDLKPKVFKRLFKLKKNLKNNYEHQGYHNAFARKVRTLFEEG